MSIEKTGAGVKNLAIGVAVIVGVVGVLYLARKLTSAAAATAEAVSEGAGFLFGAESSDATLGTWLHNKLNGDQGASVKPGSEEAHVIACNDTWRLTGNVLGATCRRLHDEGKLTAP